MLFGPAGRSCWKRVFLCGAALLYLGACERGVPQQPNILVAISDDQSWMHTSINGDPVVKTPVFDRVARSGILFTQAFCAAPNCSPSRAAMFTGQHIWRLGAAANLGGPLDKDYPVYPDMLETLGYHVGFTGKGWQPGNVRECRRLRNPAGPAYNRARDPVANFEAFLDDKPDDQPFCFWFGSFDPHYPFDAGSGREKGMDPQRVVLPPFLPDITRLRERMLDYYMEVERFDRHVGRMLEVLESRGELDNTLVIVTSDNGADLPRGKLNLYDFGTRMPLAVSWPTRIEAGRVVEDLVNLIDFAPTFVELAGGQPTADMNGRSLVDVLLSKRSGRVDPGRDHVYLARERHSPYRQGNVSYPSRAIRTHEYLYIRNFQPDRWPAGDPPYYADSGAHPMLRPVILGLRDEGTQPELYRLCYAKRPAEELYDLRIDPDQIRNVADSLGYRSVREEMWTRLKEYLETTGDPRVFGKDGGWDDMRWPFAWRFEEFRVKRTRTREGKSGR